ncbi:MAG: OmpW family outer membrane protein [Candidatus Latescibacteria bacterium]|nr:OmpW family outer membrane protein [Candidatus Latescibacterota bacterium]
MRRPPCRLLLLVCAVVLLTAASASAQSDWTLLTRLFMTGVSDGSEPAGYKVYSAFGLEVGVRRDLGRSFGLELDLGPQSREVELLDGTDPVPNLGSLEVLPLVLLARWTPDLHGAVRPYLGVGGAFTVFWEKSGALNSTEIPTELGAVVQLGADIALSPRLCANLDLRSQSLTADIADSGVPLATLRIHPTTLAVGLGYRF